MDGDDQDAAEDPAGTLPPGEAVAVPSASPSGDRTRTEQATEPVLRVLPLGSGLVLIGLGLALGLVGLRLRRG
ncbi:hypothetical protein [Streptomyces ambofaciens]|uniref:hypothetical protein n=1 Tax=Streptomyces ambofaciens TaxID=1889 RepID=UPI0011E06D34|nr:hypothetical protein [Streptomyces ambofaciens]